MSVDRSSLGCFYMNPKRFATEYGIVRGNIGTEHTLFIHTYNSILKSIKVIEDKYHLQITPIDFSTLSHSVY